MPDRPNDSIVLDDFPLQHSPQDFTEIEQAALAPTDGGKAAWLMLASCCLIQLPVWGKHLLRFHLDLGQP